MPSTSPPQKRLMAAAAHTKGGFGGVPQSVGKEFNMADKGKKFNKGGNVESSAHQAFENNKAEALVYPGPAQGLKKGGTVKAISKPVKPATGGWKRWGQK
jgi:hypothetical protein